MVSAGILAKYNGQWALLKDKGVLQDFGGRLKEKETAWQCALRKFKEEGGFSQREYKVKILEEIEPHPKKQHTIFVCEIDKLPTAVKHGTTIELHNKIDIRYDPKKGVNPLGHGVFHPRLRYIFWPQEAVINKFQDMLAVETDECPFIMDQPIKKHKSCR